MKFAYAARIQAHIHAGDRFRNAKLPRCDLTRPTAARLSYMRVRERKPQIGQRSRVGGRRVQHVRILSFADHVAWDGIRAADAWLPARLERPIRRLRHRGAQHAAGDDGSRKNVPSRELAHCFLPCGVAPRFPRACATSTDIDDI
jgi:hypothetical protein